MLFKVSFDESVCDVEHYVSAASFGEAVVKIEEFLVHDYDESPEVIISISLVSTHSVL